METPLKGNGPDPTWAVSIPGGKIVFVRAPSACLARQLLHALLESVSAVPLDINQMTASGPLDPKSFKRLSAAR